MGRKLLAFLGVLFVVSALSLTAGGWCGEHYANLKDFRVCADPNNLPFSNQKLEGFENRIAELLARDLGSQVAYTWWPQRRGFIRNTLRAGTCDVVIGVPAGYDPVLTTRPYYRSTYVFVYPKKAGYQITSLDDSILHQLRIGVHLIGDDYVNSPPAHALSAKGIVDKVVGYSVFGDYAEDSPPGKIIAAVAAGEVDMAIVWGPIAGYFAQKQDTPLELVPVPPSTDLSFLPFAYNISLGVRRGDEDLRAKLDKILERKAPEMQKILKEYGVPLVSDQPPEIGGQPEED
jgi:quinoprotein dehydrogenase-associated probable ABC transporter substrate-binding protein